MKFYTVDRNEYLSENSVYNLKIYDDVNPDELNDHVNDLFPDGVSSHGERYFLRGDSSIGLIDPMLELVFEYVRRANHPDKPSRFQSMFGFESLSFAHRFRDIYSDNDSPIYVVESDIVFKADMNILTANNSILATSYLANLYWSSKEGPGNPFWEIIIKCPVRVIERVE